MPKHVVIYTDGACSGNPGPGGWGAVLIYNEHRLELSGYEAETTNNRMELMAAIEALSALKQACRVDLYTDSSYLENAFTKGWLASWQKRGWQTVGKKPVVNQDLWVKLLELTNLHTVSWHRVKGHADNAENNRCDKLATEAVKKVKEKGKVEE